jgi:hypothetical protein
MKSAFCSMLYAIALLCAVALSGVQVAAAQAASLQGTWVVKIELHNCQTGAPIGNQFQSLLSFAQGGTLTETTSNPMFFPAERGPGHGAWHQNSDGTYFARSIALISLNGELVKTQVITQRIKLLANGQNFSSNAKVYFYDPSGALLMKGCAMAIGFHFD